MNRHAIVALLPLIFFLFPLVHAATTATTGFVFNVPTNRGHTITYGGNCTSAAFFFNEIDANFDPDTDGNAARVKPNFQRRTNSPTSLDYNFEGVAGPSDNNMVHAGFVYSRPPSDNNTPFAQLNTGGYSFFSTDNSSYVSRISNANDGNTPAFRMVFKLVGNTGLVTDLNFHYIGAAQYQPSGQTCSSGGIYPTYDVNAFIWNYRTGAYVHLDGNSGNGSNMAEDSQSIYATVIQKSLTGKIHDYIGTGANDKNVTILVAGVMNYDGGQSCLWGDYAHLGVFSHPIETNFCQSSTLAPMTVTNVGNTAINIDGNFSSAFSGVDINLELKVWQGTGSGCGVDGNGLGGWQRDCNVTVVNPEARWSMDENNGATVIDSAGNGHHGTLVGNAQFTTDICYENRCVFSLQDGNISIEDGTTYLDNNFTISTWVYIKNAQTGNTALVSTYDGQAGNRVDLNYDVGNTTITCQAGTGAGAVIPTSIVDGLHHLVCTRTTAGEVQLYLDGVIIQSGTLTTGDLDLGTSNNDFLRLGGNLNGYIDNTTIYTRALSEVEVGTLLNNGFAIPDGWQTREPGQTFCRGYTSTNATTGARLKTGLTEGSTQQFCFSGDFLGFVKAGDHNKSFQTGTDFS